MRPIPMQMLAHTVRVSMPITVDKHQQVEAAYSCDVRHTCLQRGSSTAKTKDNTTVKTTATLFVDAKLSSPQLNWLTLKNSADEAGADLVVHHDGTDYTVVSVEELLDNFGRIHHFEVGLI